MADPYAALRIRDYRFYAFGSLFSVLGEQMIDVAIGWEVYERTHSASALGFVGLAEALPVMLLALFAGHASDRYNRKHILIVVQVVMAMLSGLLAWISYRHCAIYLLYLVICAAGVARAFKSPARSALLPQIVPTHLLSSAVTWNSSNFQIASMAGPMVGGFLLAASHNFSLVYLLNSFCALSMLGFIFMIPDPAKAQPHAPVVHNKMTWQTLLAGVAFIRKTKLLLAGITLDMFAVLLGGATALLPIFAKDILHTDATGLGWLRAAPAIGAFLMAIAVSHLPEHISPLRNAGAALLCAVTGFGAATIIFGLSRSFWLSLSMLFLTGAFDNISVIIRSTLLQLKTPNEMRGRVSAVNYVFIGASNELGAFESGITAAAFGPVASVVAGGIGTILVVIGAAWIWPELRKLKKLES